MTCAFVNYKWTLFKMSLSHNNVTYQFKHKAGFGVDVAKHPIRKSLQPRPVALEERNTRTEVKMEALRFKKYHFCEKFPF